MKSDEELVEELAVMVADLRKRLRVASARALKAEVEGETLRRSCAAQEGKATRAHGRWRRAQDETRFLHGLLVLNGIDVPERLR